MIKKITLTCMLVVAMFIAFAKEHKQAAIDFLQKNLTEIKLTSQDIKDLILLDDSYDDFSHINRVWLQQTAYGIPLKNGMLSVHFMNGKVVNYTNNGIQDLKNKISSVTPSITAENAVRFAAAHVGVPSIGKIKLQEKVNKKENLYIFKPIDGLTNLEVHAQLLFTRDKNDKVVLDWEVQFHSLDQYNFWCIDVSAKDGSLIKKTDQVLHCDFGKGEFLGRHTHETEHTSINYRILDENLPSGATDGVSQTSAGSYRVYPFTVESPIYGARQLLVDPHDVVASPYGWHDTNGAAGAEYTYTRGNNVWAYTDKYDADPNTPTSLSTDGGASLVFDFNLDFTTQLDTLTNSKAITTQLFYANNIMHDIFFKYGFNESSRNFQFKNYSGASGGSDLVYAEAHDASLANPRLTNNANFATAPDGTSTPFNRTRMQMYMWDGAPPSSLTYNAPASIAGDIDHGSANGWGPCSYNVTAPVANATSNTAPPSYVCGAVNNPGDIAGKIALIDRGTCNFTEKVYNVQLAGAVGAIIINRQSAGDSLIGMASGTNGGLVTIPAMFVTYADGQKLRDNLATANVTMYRNSTTNCLDLDGSLDFGIVAHEYAHGISTRLTGLSLGTGGTSGCLSNEEQAGEGWGDFFAMALTKKPTDNKNTPRGMGNYAASQDVNGQGIRRYPYSYDMSINPLTYGDLNLNPEEHDIGEVWTSALWDMYWLLVEKHGYSNDLYNGTGGNNRAIKIVVEGLKQQKCNPGFLDSRNAILKADSILYGYADKCEIWTAFARRGMGASANQGSAGSASDQTEAFDLPAACNTTPTATASFTVSDTTVCVGGSLTFTNTSTASSGSPDSVRWTILGGTPSTSNSATTVTPTFNTAGTYVISLIAYKSGNASVAATKSIRVKSLPAVSVTSPAICSGKTAQPVASGATSYTWTGGLSSVSNPVTPALSTTTTYTVTGTKDGCTGTAVSTVTVNATPSISVTSPVICSGQTAQPVASGTSTSYSWTGGLTSVSNPVTPALSTTTTYTVTGTLGTCTNTAVSTVTVNPKPTVNVTSPTICTGQTAQPVASGTSTSYSWTGGLTSVSNPVTPALTTTTTYTVTGTLGSCTNTAVSTVTVVPSLVVTVSSPVICAGQTAQPVASGATSYTWTGGLSSVSNPVTPALSTTTTYTVTGTSGSCSATAVATVTVNANPTVNVSSPTICAGETAQPVASGTSTSYSWTGGLTSVSNPVTPALSTTTTYTVTGTLGTCTNTAVSTVTVNPKPTVTVTSPGICSGQTAQPIASGATSYSWTGGLSSVSNPVTPALTTTTTYTVTGTVGSCTNTAVSTVTVASSLGITVNSPTTCSGQAAQLSASGATSYSWTGGLTSVSNPMTPTLTTTTTYTVTGTTGACTGTAVATVTVNPNPIVSVTSPAICSGETAQPVASGATSYSWTGGLSSVSNPVTPPLTTTTTYTVTGTKDGCTGTAVSTVSITGGIATPIITQSHDTLYSSTIVVGANYEWYKSGVLDTVTTTPYYKITVSGSYTLKVVNGLCESMISAAINATVTGIKNNTNSIKELSIYPNPTEGRLVLDLSLLKTASVGISIYTAEGRELYVKTIAQTRTVYEELQIETFAKGIYIIKINVDEEVYYHKVVKQ